MTVTLDTLRHNPDGSMTQGTITITANPPLNKRSDLPISWSHFQARATDQEYVAIRTAANTQLAAGNPALDRWINEGISSGQVDVASPDAIAAKAALIAGGLLTPERADAIFAS